MVTADLPYRPTGRPRSCTCGTCRKCRQIEYARAWWERKSPEERRAHVARRDHALVLATKRRYARTRAAREALHRSLSRYPERLRARRLLHQAVESGRVRRQPCWCGATAEAHHPDYSKPLDVVWLCRRHHVDVHRAARAATA